MHQPRHTKNGIAFKDPLVFLSVRARLLCLVHYETPCRSGLDLSVNIFFCGRTVVGNF